jgi:hypothetical protein
MYLYHIYPIKKKRIIDASQSCQKLCQGCKRVEMKSNRVSSAGQADSTLQGPDRQLLPCSSALVRERVEGEHSAHKIPGCAGWGLFHWADSPFNVTNIQCYKKPRGSGREYLQTNG